MSRKIYAQLRLVETEKYPYYCKVNSWNDADRFIESPENSKYWPQFRKDLKQEITDFLGRDNWDYDLIGLTRKGYEFFIDFSFQSLEHLILFRLKYLDNCEFKGNFN